MVKLAIYVGAALAEIVGCHAFWTWSRLGRSLLWLVPGMASLALFAWLLTRIDSDFAGRTYATYGGIYIVASLFWLWAVESQRPDRRDMTGAAIYLVGAAIIIWGPRTAALQHRRTITIASPVPPFSRYGTIPSRMSRSSRRVYRMGVADCLAGTDCRPGYRRGQRGYGA